MAKRQKVWAAKARDALAAKLGGKCVKCGTTEKLTFDCIIPQGDEHHKMSFDRRISFYRAQDKIGNLQLLCKPHNDAKGDTVEPVPAPLDSNVPF